MSDLSEKEKEEKFNKIMRISITYLYTFSLGMILMSTVRSGQFEDTRNNLNDLATKNYVVSEMPLGKRSFVFENEEVLRYNPVNNSFTRSTIDDLKTKYSMKVDKIDEELKRLEANRKAFTEFESKVDSLYNSLKK